MDKDTREGTRFARVQGRPDWSCLWSCIIGNEGCNIWLEKYNVTGVRAYLVIIMLYIYAIFLFSDQGAS